MSQESQAGHVTHTVSLRQWSEEMVSFGPGFSRSSLARIRHANPDHFKDRLVAGRDGKLYPVTRNDGYVRDRAAVVLWLRSRGLSTRDIAARLTELGRPTSQSTVSRVLRCWEIASTPRQQAAPCAPDVHQESKSAE